MRHGKGKTGFEHEGMFSMCSQINPDLQDIPHSQYLGTTGRLHGLHSFFGLHPKCPGYNQNFLKSESALSRKCYNTMSTVSLFLPTLMLCSNTPDLILNLFFFFLSEKIAEISTLFWLCAAKHSWIMTRLLYFANLYVSGWETGN